MSTVQLASLLSKRLVHIKQLATLTRRQYELIVGSDITKLLELLARKQYALYEIEQLERALDPYKSEDPETRVWRSEEDRLHAAGVLEETRQLMAYVREMDVICEEELIRQKDLTEQQAKKLDTGATIATAYSKQAAPPASARGSMIDIK